MTSSAARQAARDAASYDDDRKDGRYSPGGDRSWWFSEPRPQVPALSPEKLAALDAAMAQIDRAFGPWCPVRKRHLPRQAAVVGGEVARVAA